MVGISGAMDGMWTFLLENTAKSKVKTYWFGMIMVN